MRGLIVVERIAAGGCEMKTMSIPGSLLAILLTTFISGAVPARSQEIEAPAQGQEIEAPPAANTAALNDAHPDDEQAYRQALVQMESSEGAYAAGLTESLQGLALRLQEQGQHDEAIKLFKRGTHLARVNEGLYCPQQIPLLQGEIASQVAVENFAVADERQKYLYRVQMRSLESGAPRTEALLQQAKWQYNAFQVGLDGAQSFARLMSMSDLYQEALNDVIAREGDKSPELLPPLHGMLQAQYLISSYEVRESDRVFGEDGHVNEPLLQFQGYRARSYEQGNSIIDAIASIEQKRAARDSLWLARNRVMVGDWQLWNGRTEAAWQAYREAETELARREDAQAVTRQLFGEPVALPAFADLSPLPPVVEPEQADVLLEFGVSERGRVQDLERLDENDAEDAYATRLMRQLRKTTFRPRFEAGQPVETAKLVKAFNIQ
jgi:hypothetical protein